MEKPRRLIASRKSCEELSGEIGRLSGKTVNSGGDVEASLERATPIPTVDGWKTLDEIQRGNMIFGADGKPTRVLFVSEMQIPRTCYRLLFGDGSEIVAGGEHQWLTRHAYRPWANPVSYTHLTLPTTPYV